MREGRFSPTDLSAFSECRHRTLLDLAASRGELRRPGVSEIERALLEKRGRDHEARVVEMLRAEGRSIVELSPNPGNPEAAAKETLAAMRAGAEVISQGTLTRADWVGRPDFLVRAGETYEPWDAKLAQSAKGAALLQVCAYVDAVTEAWGKAPESFALVLGGAIPVVERFRVADYMAYYRRALVDFAALLDGDAEPYPEPVSHCDVCAWWKRCEERRRADDHLSLVADITKKQRERLERSGVTRVAELSRFDGKVEGLAAASLARARAQARIQVEGSAVGRVLYELRADCDAGAGLAALPPPTPGDLFFDLEGDAFVEGTGLEYLFGLVELGEPVTDFSERTEPGPPRYRGHWAVTRAEEKRAFEAIIDRIMAGRAEFSDLHVFHFGHREADAVRRLSCFHKTREAQVDTLLREHVFVDLHRIVKQALRASVESYGLKQLEPLYAFERKTPLREAARAMQLFGYGLEMREPDDELRSVIEAYNREDCLSTDKLREFLESLRTEAHGRPARPEPEKEKVRDEDVAATVRRLTRDLPESAENDTPAQAARRLLSTLLDWHWREDKSGWWEYYRVQELAPSERLEDHSMAAELSHAGKVESLKRRPVHRYEFPEQRHGLRVGSKVKDFDHGKEWDVVDVGPTHVSLVHTVGFKGPYPKALGPSGPIYNAPLKASLLELGQSVAEMSDVRRCAWDLLTRSPPRTSGNDLTSLEDSVVSVQGPPGSGKTYMAADAIVALIAKGKRVGVTANSHAVIQHLLDKAVELGVPADRVRHVHTNAVRRTFSDEAATLAYEVVDDYGALRGALDSGGVSLVGGTAWAWSNDALKDAVDFLVVDEAGQMSLANVLSASRGTKNLILVGDPTQLSQPTKGVHPPGSGVSALEHVLGGARTMPPELGAFLEHTRRLHPDICAFTSEVFYEDRLTSLPGLERQAIKGKGRISGSGLRFVPVEHRGNTDQSAEEARVVAALTEELIGATYTDDKGKKRKLRPEDMLVVAPYNAQVHLLRQHVPEGVRVGTVDKFQGKEAPVAIYSLAASSTEDAARGADFLLDPHRLNVATSRARAVAVVVASPSLLATHARSPRAMRLANALCRYVELATPIT